MRCFFFFVLLFVFASLAGAVTGVAAADQTLSVTVDKDAVSLEAVNAPLDRVLAEIGKALNARVVVETVVADDLAKARVDSSFSRVPAVAAFRRLLRGRHYVLLSGPAGTEEVRIYVDGTTGYRELTPATPEIKRRATTIPVATLPPPDPLEVARLRRTVMDSADPSARAEGLDELSNSRDARALVETLTQMLVKERDSKVLDTVFELAAQQQERIAPEVLRTFAASDRAGTARAQAVELLADQAGDDPATRALLRSLAASDASSDVRDAARMALGHLEAPPPPLAPEPTKRGAPAPRMERR